MKPTLIVFAAILTMCATTGLCADTITSASSAKTTAPSVEQLPFPNDASSVMLLSSLERIRGQVLRLEGKIGFAPYVYTDEQSRKEVYLTWSSAILSALAIRQTEGNTEPMMCVMAALYRQGHNLNVAECETDALDTVQLALEMYPNSISVNWQAAYLYLQMSGSDADAKAESSLLKLRTLMRTDANFEVERRLAALYVRQTDLEKARAQVAHCLVLRPDDVAMQAFQKDLDTRANGSGSVNP